MSSPTPNFHLDVTLALDHGDAEGVIAELARTKKVADQVHFGFNYRGRNESFAHLCVRKGQVAVLEKVLQAQPGGLTIDDLTRCLDVRGLREEPKQISLYLEAALDGSADGLNLAFRCQPGHPDLRAELSGTKRTLHHIVLAYAAREQKNASISARYIACARVLLRHADQAPILNGDASTNPVGDAFFAEDWQYRFGADVAELMADYYAAGLLDLNKPIDFRTRDVGGSAPLAAMLKAGNQHAAAKLIALGADLEFALDPEFPDLVAQLRSFGHAREDEFAAVITEALMLRRLMAHRPLAAAEVAPVSRRRARML